MSSPALYSRITLRTTLAAAPTVQKSTTQGYRAGVMASLTTLAYCMNTTCDSLKVSTNNKEQFWTWLSTSDPAVLPEFIFQKAFSRSANYARLSSNLAHKALWTRLCWSATNHGGTDQLAIFAMPYSRSQAFSPTTRLPLLGNEGVLLNLNPAPLIRCQCIRYPHYYP